MAPSHSTPFPRRREAGPRTVDLTDLVVRVDHGDEAAMRALLDSTRPRLAHVVRALVQREIDVEEILLDVYEQVWRQAGRFDRALGSVWTWLVVIARSRALDFLRAQRARDSRRGTLVLDEEPTRELDPAEDCAEEEERHRVSDALAALSPNQRQTLRVVFFEGLSHREAAERLHVPLGTVKSRVRRGLEALEAGLRVRDNSKSGPLATEDRAS